MFLCLLVFLQVLVATDNKFLKLLKVEKCSSELSEVFFVETEEFSDQIAVWPNVPKFVTATGKTVATWSVDDAIFKVDKEYR